MLTKKQLVRGFTIIELLVVITIVGILASITLVVYSGVQNKARDVSVQSDLDRMEALQTAYGIKHNTAGKAYYSGNGADSDLPFTPSNNNVISVVVNATDYCLRGYNTSGDYNSIENSLIKESTPGVCATIVPIYAPSAPAISVVPNSGNVLATVIPSSCITGTIQYSIRNRINNGSWSGYTAWSAGLTDSQPVAEGTKYGYMAQARCYANEELISESTASLEVSYTSPVDSPPVPTITIVLNGANVQSSIDAPSSCSAGLAQLQYRFAYRTNDGTWGSYNAWAASTTATTAAIEGRKFGSRAEARCYIDADNFSSPSAGSPEMSYIHPITSVPGGPTVNKSTPDWYSTTFSWSTTACASGLSARWQYHYYTNYGYDSGWVATDGVSVSFVTAKINYYYTTDVKVQCYSVYSTGPWGTSNYTQYYRPVPGVQVLVVAGGGGGGASSSDASGGGGGGGGVLYHSSKAVYSQGYWVTVGAGGQCNSCGGGNSAFQDITAFGGGGGGPTNSGGYNGGNGGGGAGAKSGSTNDRGYTTQYSTGGAGPVPGYSYGYNGGRGQWRNNGKSGGGGGGAGMVGGDAYDAGGNGKMCGGNGAYSTITGGGAYYAAGGGGGSVAYWGSGGAGGGGNGAQNGTGAGGANDTGSGGGGGSGGGWGGTGIVIIRYPVGLIWADGGSKYQNGSDYVHIFYYGGGTLTVAG
ncbi:hypothetical protein COV88_03200 [Candidatus Saccharibacteria bacterium CG11_big_fil_rev_8_21_14_0_20_41_19]|nr:MAG: hypothetical protein COV88_03200 [Candidatus Saccharibacteria bacterium CG11_big_fil_rev_8_21_14_0_20_41_19]